MATTVHDPREQVKLLKSTILMSLGLKNGFGAIQALLRKACAGGLISNESQQNVLSACEPLRSEVMDPSVSRKMVAEIERILKAEINKWNRVLNPG